MLVNEMIGKTTLMAFAVTPRELVLALVTGVGGVLAPDGAATSNATVLPRTARTPPTLSILRLATRFSPAPHRHLPRVRRSNRAARERVPLVGPTNHGSITYRSRRTEGGANDYVARVVMGTLRTYGSVELVT